MERILTIRGGAIGDFLLTLPTVARLKAEWPEARLEALGYPSIAELGLGRGYFEAVRSMDRSGLPSFFIPDTILDPEWMDYFRSFDLIVSYLYDPDGFFRANVEKCQPGRLLSVSPKVEEGRPAAFHLAAPLGELELELTSPAARLHPNDEDREAARQAHPVLFDGAPWIAVHPGSGSASKNWPALRWVDVIQACLETRLGRVALIGGEAEGGRLQELAGAITSSGADRVHVVQDLPLPALAALLAGARLFLGHDSGISHLAAAAGAPVLTLFGPTDPATWAPQGERVRVLVSESGFMDGIEVEEVRQAMDALLGPADA
ncbi:MAG: glycosyltransferase family 9 protein [Verrucomicrobiota bacterium]